MIDYWEALGRLAYEKGLYAEFEKVLLYEFKRAFPPNGTIPWVNVTKKDITETGLDIPKHVYQRVQQFLGPILAEQHVSVFVAGELIWTFSGERARKGFEEMNAIVSQAPPELFSPSTSYFIALGILLVDGNFRRDVMKSADGGAALLPRLTDPQRKQLEAVLHHPGFKKALNMLTLIWDEGCNDDLICRVEYRHPLAANAAPKKHSPAPPAPPATYEASASPSTP